MKFLLLIFKNVSRNKLRTVITCLALMVLVLVVTLIWTVTSFVDNLTRDKGGNLKVVVTDRYDMQGQLPLSYVGPLAHGAADKPGDKVSVDSMAWQFYVGTLDARKKTRENLVELIATDARHIPTKVGKHVARKGMIDTLDPVDKVLVDKLGETSNGCLLGWKRLKTLNKKVGERFKMSGSHPAGLDLEFEIVGMLPPGRWDENGIMNARYLNAAIDKLSRDFPARKRVLDRRIDIFWIEASQREDVPQLIQQINSSPLFREPPVKCETYASLAATYVEAYGGFIWFMRWVLAPGSIFSMVLLIANAISLNVGERVRELATLKVIGYRPSHLVVLVLGEALFLGTGSGAIAGGLIYWLVNSVFGGVVVAGSEPYPVPWQAFLWVAGVGWATALAGSILPARTACSVRVSQVFARVA